MVNETDDDSPAEMAWREARCPVCDSRLPAHGSQCLMCGAEIPHDLQAPIAKATPPPAATPEPAERVEADEPEHGEKEIIGQGSPQAEATIESIIEERQSPILWLVLAIVATILVTVLIGPQPQQPAAVVAEANATVTQETLVFPPTLTPMVLPTTTPTPQPTQTPTTLPTPTLQPPVNVTVAPGDTLFTLGFRFNVTMDSIANLNGLSVENPIIQQGQQLNIPQPTATPPLTAVTVQLGNERIIADPTDCTRHEIQQADTLSRIALNNNVPLQALVAVNRLTTESILQPGDTICIPVIQTAVEVFAPESELAQIEVGLQVAPRLLSPPQDMLVPSDVAINLAWLSQRDLIATEWYMVEWIVVSAVDTHPWRAFTRQTSFQVPPSWRPTSSENSQIQWRISIVTVTGERNDGAFIYTPSGESSQPSQFTLE